MKNFTISIPGSKSYTNRALIMAALTNPPKPPSRRSNRRTKGPVTLVNYLESDDTLAMINCLKRLGIRIKKEKSTLTVENDINDIKDKHYELDADLSGTTIRFILALSCIVPGVKRIFGKEGLNKRPIKDLVLALKTAGADIEYEDISGFPPVIVKSSFLPNGNIFINGNTSSQFVSALLMISPVVDGITLEVIGNQISKSYIDITISMMKDWGVQVENHHYQKYIVSSNQKYNMKRYLIEGDYSAAGYFAAIAALKKSKITIKNLNPSSVQGDRGFLTILEKMGNKIIYNENAVTIEGKNVKPMEVNMEDCPDQAQTLAVLTSFAKGKTIIKGIRSLRVKETERVKALQTELKKMGIKTESPDEDTLIIFGGNPKPAEIKTYNDHRMAMSFAVASVKLAGMKILNPEVVNKTFPEFWKKLAQI